MRRTESDSAAGKGGTSGEGRKNREWNQFLQRRNVVFRPVARGQDERREATDEAIHDKIKSLARAKGVDFVALLSSDQGFLSPLQQCIASGTKVALFVPETCFGAIKFYKGNGVHVRKLPVEQNSCHIRALLHADGRGTVNRAEAYEGCLTDEAVTELEGFLQDWGEPSCFLIQLLAKFWFVNSLGTLTVFPLQHGVMAARDVITSASSVQSWQSCGQQLAFVLPVAGVGKAANFGSGLARRIFYGGGPFMLSDSANLTCAALTKLGYLDEDLNTDLTEAILCFINATDNKTKLRKLDLLPADHAEARQIDAQLRQAFLCFCRTGQTRSGELGPDVPPRFRASWWLQSCFHVGLCHGESCSRRWELTSNVATCQRCRRGIAQLSIPVPSSSLQTLFLCG